MQCNVLGYVRDKLDLLIKQHKTHAVQSGLVSSYLEIFNYFTPLSSKFIFFCECTTYVSYWATCSIDMNIIGCKKTWTTKL